MKYTARQPFKGDDSPCYIDIEHENGFHDWLQVKDVPEPLRDLISQDRLRLESAECKTMKDAKALAAWMNRFHDSSEKRASK